MFDSFAAAAYRRVVKGPLEKHRTEGPAAKDIPFFGRRICWSDVVPELSMGYVSKIKIDKV